MGWCITIEKKLMKLRLQPIRVFCLHHVCGEFDAESMNSGDWMDIEEFKTKVLALRAEGVELISLTEAYHHICKDRIRCKKYAVLTFDDGYASLKEILPWLNEQNIPAALFINGKYLDGKSYRTNPEEQYLTRDELWRLTSPLIEIGNHGWEHVRVTGMNDKEFEKSVEWNVDLLSTHPNYVSFWAYAYGVCTEKTNACLYERGIVPLYVDGIMNFNELNKIHREEL